MHCCVRKHAVVLVWCVCTVIGDGDGGGGAAALVVVVVVVVLWRCLFTIQSLILDDPPDDKGCDRCPECGVYALHLAL